MIMLSHCFYVWFSSDETFATAPMHPQHKNSENPTSDISSYSKITIVPIGRAKHARETPYNFCWLCQLLPKSFMMTNNENEWPLSWEYDDSFFIAQSLQAAIHGGLKYVISWSIFCTPQLFRYLRRIYFCIWFLHHKQKYECCCQNYKCANKFSANVLSSNGKKT